jgi:formyltetrahydrofolate hydrolase
MTTTLLIHCPDQPGLIYNITSVIFKYQLNIISNGEFVERNFNHFFMRTEFAGEFDQEGFSSDLAAILPREASIKLSSGQKRDIALLVTKEHHCLSDLLIRYAFQELNANIRCVVSNYSNLQDFTEKFSIPFHFVSHMRIRPGSSMNRTYWKCWKVISPSFWFWRNTCACSLRRSSGGISTGSSTFTIPSFRRLSAPIRIPRHMSVV